MGPAAWPSRNPAGLRRRETALPLQSSFGMKSSPALLLLASCLSFACDAESSPLSDGEIAYRDGGEDDGGEEPKDLEPYTQQFHAALRFNHPENPLVFDRHCLDHAIAGGSPALRRLINSLLHRHRWDDIESKVEWIITNLLPLDQVSLEAVAQAAVDHILPRLDSKSIVGVGTGSTANFFIDALAKHKMDFDGAVASSEATAARLKGHGIPVYDLNAVNEIEFYVDGADETNESLELIKGGGGALTREKIVAAVAKTFICIADESKQVGILGEFPLPVEVIPMARSHVGREIVKLGGDPVYRDGFVTDNGNIIIDIHNMDISRPLVVEEKLNNIVGVVTNGLFARRPADLLLLGTRDGVKSIVRGA
mgnify:CR=1 FL=1